MTKPEDALVERLRPRAGCSNKHCGDSSPCRDCVGCFLDTALDAITTLIERERRLREALEYIVRQTGTGQDGLIDWQRCVDRIQSAARAALTREGE